MNLDELKRRVTYCIKRLEELCPVLEIRYVRYEKTSQDREIYHVQIDCELKLSADEKRELGLKEVDPNLGFNFDLDFYADKAVLDCLATVFSRATEAFMHLKKDLPIIVKNVEFE